jgi:2-deoxy-D-gluconate 3-dehydrogenase
MILDRFKLDGRVAVVTGGNRGLGLGIATALAEAGADIVSIQRTDAVPALQEAVARVGRRTLSLTLDLTTDDAAAEALAATLRHYGRVDILVNNAGVQRRASAADVPIADWDAIVAVDLRAVFAVSQTVGREMLRQGSGKIINVTSLLAFQGESLVLACATSKHGVAGLTQALCNEWASYGINVNVIAPGYMDTEMNVALRANPGRSRVIGDRRADSDRTVGHVSGSGRRGILPRVAGLGLRAWSHDRRGWQVACPLATRGYWRRRTARGLQLPRGGALQAVATTTAICTSTASGLGHMTVDVFGKDTLGIQFTQK